MDHPQPTAKPTRERFLDAAADLFQRQGYAATGVNEITRMGGAPKGSLYFHFPGGKEQLGAEALTLAGQRFERAIRATLDAAPHAAAAIDAIIHALCAGLESSDYQLGCAIATTTLETAATSDAIAACADAAFQGWLTALAARFQRDGATPEDAERDAMLALSAIEGALVLSRAARSTRPLRTVAESLARTHAAANRPSP